MYLKDKTLTVCPADGSDSEFVWLPVVARMCPNADSPCLVAEDVEG